MSSVIVVNTLLEIKELLKNISQEISNNKGRVVVSTDTPENIITKLRRNMNQEPRVEVEQDELAELLQKLAILKTRVNSITEKMLLKEEPPQEKADEQVVLNGQSENVEEIKLSKLSLDEVRSINWEVRANFDSVKSCLAEYGRDELVKESTQLMQQINAYYSELLKK